LEGFIVYQMNFNRSSIIGLPAAESRARNEYRDPSEPGLYLHVTRTGLKTFFLYRKHKGKPVRLKLGRFPDISVTQAKKRAQEIKGALALQHIELPHEKLERENAKVLLKDVSEEYFEVRTLKEKTVHEYRRGLRNHMADWMEKPIENITKDQVIKKHRYIAEHSGKSMADSIMRTLRTLFEFFKDRHDYAGDNPVKTLSVNRLWKTGVSNRRTRYIHRKDLPAWYTYIDGLPNQIWRDYILFILFTGQG